jgi:hypothetical protein
VCIDALHKIGFIWNTSNYYWNVNYTNLHSYYTKYGHYCISKRIDSKLYSYVTTNFSTNDAKEEML